MIQDLFSKMDLFFPLLGFFILYTVITIIGMTLVLPGIFIMLAVVYFCVYMIPLMVDKDMGLVDAIKKSYALSLHGDKVDHMVAVLLYIVIISIGGSFFVGTLFTLPFATIFMLLVYAEKLNAFDASDNTKIESGEAT